MNLKKKNKKITRKRLSPNTRRRTIIKGGKVIDSGGFGCIFSPELRCKNSNNNNNSSKLVTKLMKTKYAKSEYEEIIKYKPMLQKISNYTKYFLIDGFSLCKPDKLNHDDLIGFDEKCGALTKKNITSKNVNESLDELTGINMPYGGINVNNYIEKHGDDPEKIINLNKSLIELLKNGIIPMNNHNVFNCDIKSNNILVSYENDKIFTRIIDWGLSTLYYPNKPIPDIIDGRPFQFNMPFSVILFNSLFKEEYDKFLNKNEEFNYHTVRTFIINFVIIFVNKKGQGHIKLINSIIKELFENNFVENIDEQFKNNIIEFDYTFYFIFDYLTQILLKYTNNKKFQEIKYFNEIFIKNLDIWGFVNVYIPILEFLHNNFAELSKEQEVIIHNIKDIYFILLDNSIKPININNLIEKLESFNSSLRFLNNNNNNNKNVSVSHIKTPIISKKNDKISDRTRKNKKNKFYNKIIKSLKNIKILHKNNLWM